MPTWAAVKVVDPLIVVKEYLSELEEQSDLVILLSRLGLEEDRVLAERVVGVDISVRERTPVQDGQGRRRGPEAERNSQSCASWDASWSWR